MSVLLGDVMSKNVNLQVNTNASQRLSNSSDEVEGLDTSDETNGEISAQMALFNRMNLAEQQNVIFAGESTGLADLSGGRRDSQRPSTSGAAVVRHERPTGEMRQRMYSHHEKQMVITPEEKAQKLIDEADANKARKSTTNPGKPIDWDLDLNKQFHLVIVDEDFLLVAAHVDSTTYGKIITGEYVDFAKLLPRDRVQQEDDHRLQMVFRGGHAYWVPANDRDLQSIHSFGRWEQAFRVYSDIYLRRHPDRSTELIQYNHVIYSASLSYVWDNIYAYDKDFRLHLGRHPDRSWGIILQQSWSMWLKDRLVKSDFRSRNNDQTPGRYAEASTNDKDEKAVGVNRICRRYNKGRCSFGPSCRYEHRCSYCFKFGHSIINCQKLVAEHQRRGSKGHDRNDKREHRRREDRGNDRNDRKESTSH